MHRPIKFLHRGQRHEVADLPVTTTVLSWLREHARCTGTKEGCNEGDCGACTVVIAELADDPRTVTSATETATVVGELRLRPMNACLMFLGTLDGRALLTVEDVTEVARMAPVSSGATQTSSIEHAALHPVQQALVDCHGSQCGFCTPGFVMTMFAAYERAVEHQHAPSRREWAHELAGNLCRCTGYRPILDAAQQCLELPVQRLNTSALVQALRELRADIASQALDYNSVDPITGNPQRLQAPLSAQAVAQALEADPDAQVLAGATDIALWSNKGFRPLGNLVYVGRAADLHEIRVIEGDDGQRTLRIGAAASLEDAWGALCAQWPSLLEVTLRFASPPVRHLGTMGGNLANGSPIGDSAPVLMALGADLQMRLGSRSRSIAIDDFYLGYMKKQLDRGEFIEAIDVPLHAAPTVVRAWKISKRFDSDISAVCAAFALTFNEQGRLEGARLAFGGMAATVSRARKAEQALMSHGWSQDGVEQAVAALAHDYTPMSDLRASASYRLRVAGQLLRRLWLEQKGDGPGSSGLSVWDEWLRVSDQ